MIWLNPCSIGINLRGCDSVVAVLEDAFVWNVVFKVHQSGSKKETRTKTVRKIKICRIKKRWLVPTLIIRRSCLNSNHAHVSKDGPQNRLFRTPENSCKSEPTSTYEKRGGAQKNTYTRICKIFCQILVFPFSFPFFSPPRSKGRSKNVCKKMRKLQPYRI